MNTFPLYRQKIGIIGANGNIGKELLKLFKQYDIPICAFVRNPINVESEKNVFRHFDFNQINRHAFDDIQKLFWLTPNNVDIAQEQWLPILKTSPIDHIVVLSSMHPSIFNLDRSENLIMQSGIPYTILRPNTFMQNFNNHDKNSIVNSQAFYFPGSHGKTSFIDVRDIAQTAANLLMSDKHHNKIYTLTGSETLDYYQVADIFSEVLEKNIRYIDTHKFPEFETEVQKNNVMRQDFFSAVRDNLFSKVTEDLENILDSKPKSFKCYVKDYWT